jgi:cbb3-type cytochrome oxidase subunit 3
MTDEEVKSIAARVGLLRVVALFRGGLVYVFWPGNAKRFETAGSIPLAKDPDDTASGDGYGR